MESFQSVLVKRHPNKPWGINRYSGSYIIGSCFHKRVKQT